MSNVQSIEVAHCDNGSLQAACYRAATRKILQC
jgi:hypothetical protein